MIPWLQVDEAFPPLDTALTEPNGLLAAGAALSIPRLQAAYRQGIFPWFNPGDPILWWSPDPRMVLFPSEFKLSRSLRKRLKRPDYSIRVDTAFTQVMQACAAPRDGQRGTWINPGMVKAYTAWHKAGEAHSFETWMPDEDAEGEAAATANCADSNCDFERTKRLRANRIPSSARTTRTASSGAVGLSLMANPASLKWARSATDTASTPKARTRSTN